MDDREVNGHSCFNTTLCLKPGRELDLAVGGRLLTPTSMVTLNPAPPFSQLSSNDHRGVSWCWTQDDTAAGTRPQRTRAAWESIGGTGPWLQHPCGLRSLRTSFRISFAIPSCLVAKLGSFSQMSGRQCVQPGWQGCLGPASVL